MISMGEGYLGYTDSMTPYSKARVEKILDKRWRYNGEGVFCQKDYLLKAAIEGRVSETLMESHSYYAGHLEYKQTKPKRVYRLYNLGSDNVFLELKKTEYDFYEWLKSEGLTTEDAVSARLEAEEAAAKEAREKAEREAEKARALAEAERESYRQAEIAVQRAIDELPQSEIDLMDKIFIDTVGIMPCNYTLLGEIHNFDNPICKERICEVLHNANKASIKTFECVTGLELPKSQKARMEYLNSISSADFKGVCVYKQRPLRKGEEYFYISCGRKGEKRWHRVIGVPVNICGYDCFVIREGTDWNVSHVQSGICVRKGSKKEEAIHRAEEVLQRQRTAGQLADFVNEVVAEIGESPYLLNKKKAIA